MPCRWRHGQLQQVKEAETELFYSRNIATFWDLQIGVQHDFKPDPDRTFAAFGLQGLARYWFEVEATGYISEDGDLSAGYEIRREFTPYIGVSWSRKLGETADLA